MLQFTHSHINRTRLEPDNLFPIQFDAIQQFDISPSLVWQPLLVWGVNATAAIAPITICAWLLNCFDGFIMHFAKLLNNKQIESISWHSYLIMAAWNAPKTQFNSSNFNLSIVFEPTLRKVWQVCYLRRLDLIDRSTTPHTHTHVACNDAFHRLLCVA